MAPFPSQMDCGCCVADYQARFWTLRGLRQVGTGPGWRMEETLNGRMQTMQVCKILLAKAMMSALSTSGRKTRAPEGSHDKRPCAPSHGNVMLDSVYMSCQELAAPCCLRIR